VFNIFSPTFALFCLNLGVHEGFAPAIEPLFKLFFVKASAETKKASGKNPVDF